jgi:hypothetical protein
MQNIRPVDRWTKAYQWENFNKEDLEVMPKSLE